MLNIQQFNFSPHPYLLPNFMDTFTWSIPFVTEKVMEMLLSLIKPIEGEDDDDDDDDKDNEGYKMIQEALKIACPEESKKPVVGKDKINRMKGKIRFMNKMLIMQRTLREESETIIKIKNENGDKLPKGLLLEGKEGRLVIITNSILCFPKCEIYRYYE